MIFYKGEKIMDMNILKIIFLFIGVWMTLVNTGKIWCRHAVSTLNFLLQTVGIVGFIVLQFNLI